MVTKISPVRSLAIARFYQRLAEQPEPSQPRHICRECLFGAHNRRMDEAHRRICEIVARLRHHERQTEELRLDLDLEDTLHLPVVHPSPDHKKGETHAAN